MKESINSRPGVNGRGVQGGNHSPVDNLWITRVLMTPRGRLEGKLAVKG